MTRAAFLTLVICLSLPEFMAEAQVARTATPQVTIAGKTWMAVNLETKKFRNGTLVPEARTAEEWKKAAVDKKPAWCRFTSDTGSVPTYGLLYNWYAATDPRGLCPAGWHLPSPDELTGLITASGGEDDAGIVLKSTDGWSNNANGNNSSGFNARPGGYRDYDGEFHNQGDYGMWWSSDKGNDIMASYLVTVNIGGATSVRDGGKGDGYSIRCVKSSASGTPR